MIRVFLLFAAFIPSLFAQVDPPKIPFEANVNFLKLPPNVYFGEVAGVAVNAQKHIFVFSRGNSTGPAYGATAAQLLEFGPQGDFIREIGKNLYAWSYAHAVKIRARRFRKSSISSLEELSISTSNASTRPVK